MSKIHIAVYIDNKHIPSSVLNTIQIKSPVVDRIVNEALRRNHSNLSKAT